jgi:hypothetical protein
MEQDGDLSSVDPSLLKLCQNAEQWKEQRRRALQEKVFANRGPQQAATSSTLATSSSSSSQGTSDNAGDEAYVLAQLMSHKRKREAESTAPQTSAPLANNNAPPTAPTGGMSLKEKLMQKYNSAQ